MLATSTSDTRQVGLLAVSFLAFLVGSVTGAGAILFRALIAIIHNLFFNAQLSMDYDANVLETLGPWGPFIILAPIIGGMGVIFLVRNFAPEAKGHGVPEVMYAIYYREGRIRPVVALVKSLASALSIGSGAAVGREGPIIQIGSSFGSTLGQLTRVAVWQRNTLIAAGAGAGIAATFNTPLGGVLFAVELMLPEVSPRTFLPVVIATGTAAYIGRLAFGLQPAFLLPSELISPGLEPQHAEVLILAVLLGVLCGLASWAFIRVLAAMEDIFEKVPLNDYLRHAIGMAIVGSMMYLLARGFGHYFIEGVGYGTIQAILLGNMTSLSLMTLLCVLKLLATTVSLGSGASGGIFSPALFIGATIGGAFGAAVEQFWPLPDFGIAAFAMIGMAGVVGGATGAAMTAIVMIFEMTADYSIMIPMIIAVGVSTGLRRFLSEENIYTIKLARRGQNIPKERHSHMYRILHARQVMDTRIAILPDHVPLEKAVEVVPEGEDRTYVIVSHEGHITGVVPLGMLARPPQDLGDLVVLEDVAIHDFVLAREDDILNDVLKRLGRRPRAFALVVRGTGIPRAGDVVGVIGAEQIGKSILAYMHG
jgi:CIC family chloride channel protein